MPTSLDIPEPDADVVFRCFHQPLVRKVTHGHSVMSGVVSQVYHHGEVLGGQMDHGRATVMSRAAIQMDHHGEVHGGQLKHGRTTVMSRAASQMDQHGEVRGGHLDHGRTVMSRAASHMEHGHLVVLRGVHNLHMQRMLCHHQYGLHFHWMEVFQRLLCHHHHQQHGAIALKSSTLSNPKLIVAE